MGSSNGLNIIKTETERFVGEACDKHESSKLHAVALLKLASYSDSHEPQSHGTVEPTAW